MPRPKAAPFYLFLLHLKDEHRRETGNYLPPDRLHAYAAAKWGELDPTGKNHWKAVAERKNEEARKEPPQIRAPVKAKIPFELMNRHQQLLHLAEEYVDLCGPERLAVMKRSFVSCSITPFFRSNTDTEVYYPGEICLVRWSIARGVEELYQVYLDPGVGKDAKDLRPKEWQSWYPIMTCKDKLIIAKEILQFVGRAGGVLVRESQMRRIDSCLNYFYKGLDIKIPTFDQLIILHHLIERETNAKKLPLMEVSADFGSYGGTSGVRMSVDGVHTGVRCAWHDNKAVCSARRVVEDSYVMSRMLGEVFCANILPGTHWPSVGKLVPKVGHLCSRRTDAFKFKKESKAEWEKFQSAK